MRLTEGSAGSVAICAPIEPEIAKPDHLPALDGLRGIACLMVILGHGSYLFVQREGVYLFFALSGFLITRNLMADRANPHRVRDFYVKRFARLMPAYLAMIVAVAIVYHASVSACLWQLSYFNNNISGAPYLMHLTVSWSLCVEEQFYTLWPLAIWMLGHRAWRVAGWIVLLSPLMVLATASWFESQPFMIYSATTSNLLPLCIGALLALFEAKWRTGNLRMIALCGAALFAVGAIGRTWPVSLSPAFSLARFLWFSQLACAGVLCVALSGRSQIMNALCLNKYMKFLGRISYGVYLIHMPAMEWFDNRIGPSLPARLVAVGVVVAIAWASFEFFELPIARVARRWIEKRKFDQPVLYEAQT